jgi:hypothetical protein
MTDAEQARSVEERPANSAAAFRTRRAAAQLLEIDSVLALRRQRLRKSIGAAGQRQRKLKSDTGERTRQRRQDRPPDRRARERQNAGLPLSNSGCASRRERRRLARAAR